MVGRRSSKLITSIFVMFNLFSEIFFKFRIHFGEIHSKRANRAIAVSTLSFILILQIVLLHPVDLIQNAEAALPVSEITSKKYTLNNKERSFLTSIVLYGAAKTTIHFEYRGFDDNDRVVELQCSWDGVNYAKSNCTSESAETQSTFTGPDGVSRTYNVKTGSALRELTPSTALYTFGVRMLNSNLQLSEPTILKFSIHPYTKPAQSNNDQVPAPPPAEVIDRTIKVRFDSITINDDHDHFGFTSIGCCSGEWWLSAYVQGYPVTLLQFRGDVDDGDTYQFGTSKELVFNVLKDQPQAISIMTLGNEDDDDVAPFGGFCAAGYPVDEIKALLNNPLSKWRQAIHDYQVAEPLPCDAGEDNYDKLGFINQIFFGGDFGAGEHNVKSESGDFNLRFTILVEPYVPKPVSQEYHNVKVNFDSITVHHNHEDSFNGNAEYHPFVFVHGMGIDLAQVSEFGVCGGEPTHCGGLWDVKTGQTITFKPDTSITVALPASTPLSIFTIGEEVDSCVADFHDFLPDIRIHEEKYPGYYGFTFFNNPYDWSVAKEKIAQFQKTVVRNADCPGNDDEVLGTINELYEGPDYEARPHEVTSSSGDFTLRYTVSVGPAEMKRAQLALGPVVAEFGSNVMQFKANKESGKQEQQQDAPLLKQNQKSDTTQQQQVIPNSKLLTNKDTIESEKTSTDEPIKNELQTNKAISKQAQGSILQKSIESARAQQFIPSLKATNDEPGNNKKAKTNANNAADSTTETPTTVLKCTNAGPEPGCNGTDNSDYMVGDLQRNYMNGLKGDDYIAGSTNEDYLLGSEGNDKVDGEDGNEYLIDGGEGDDLLIGGRGEDVIKGGIGKDNINGGQENDVISHTSSWTGVSDGFADIIDCGDGSDEVWINAIPDNDVVQNCENVHRGGDLDNDGKEDKTDNCRTISNPDQKDFDEDKIGDKCDPDDDNDKVGDARDNCDFEFNPDQKDSDHDRIGDACDPSSEPNTSKEPIT